MNAHPVRHPSRSNQRSAAAAASLEKLESRLLFRVQGLDVSQFQGVIDWNEVAANGKQFTFMRSSRTNLTKDPTFDTNRVNAVAAGLLVGAYHFTLPNSFGNNGPLVDPVLDAQKFFNAASPVMQTGFLRPVIDAESGGPELGKEAYSQWIQNFSDEIERLSGVTPIIYVNINYAVNYITEAVAADHDLWLARYNGGNDPSTVDPETSQPEVAGFHPNPYGAWNIPFGGPRDDSSWDFWQYTSNGDGIATGVSSSDLDLDLFNGSLDELKERFMIGFQKNVNGVPFAVAPGATTVIQAEDYDIGGQDVSYNDTTPTVNDGGVDRTSVREGVDLAPNSTGPSNTDFHVRNTARDEYVEYTIDVAQTDEYTLNSFVSQTEPGATFHLEIDGQALPAQAVPDTDSFTAFAAAAPISTSIAAGRHVVRVTFDEPAVNGLGGEFDRLEISETPAPPPPPPAPTFPDGIADGASYVAGGVAAEQNFGQASELLVQRGRGANNTKYTYLRFNLGQRTSLSSAKLRLTGHLSDSATSSLTSNVFGVGKTRTIFDENTLTFRNKPAGKKRLGTITVTGTADGTYELDLTAFLQAELAAGRNVVTLVLKNVTKSVTTQSVFASDELVTGPVLTVS